MRKKNRLTYLWIFCALLLLMSRSKSTSDWAQGALVSAFAPIWQRCIPPVKENADLLKLQAENQLLKNEVGRMQELLKEAFYLKKEVQQRFFSQDAIQSYPGELKHLLKRRLEAIPARVIYRAPASWNSYLWIDTGQSTNLALNRQVVAKNSPVVVGNSLVGVIDYVGKHQARVKLITDPELTPAVRSVRGSPQAMRLVDTINVLLDNIMAYEGPYTTSQEKEALLIQLEKLQAGLAKQRDTLYLAKGELQGCSSPHHRSHGNLLKGTGFNYDYADEKGPARDLRSGQAYDASRTIDQAVPLLKAHDLLCTSGLDGIFPEGLQVAEVINVDPLEEGSYYYELQAKPTAGNLDALSLVFVMAPQGFDPQDGGAG